MITFQLKGDKHVVKQVEGHVTLQRPLQTDRHSLPLWSNAPKNKYVDVTRIKCERITGDFDVVFEASPDVQLSIDYNKGDDYIGFYHHKGIRRIGLFEHETNTLITEIKIAKGSKKPVNFFLSELKYFTVGKLYLQNFYEFWKKAYDYAQDFKLSGLRMDGGNLTSTITDFYDCNVDNVGEGLNQFDFNSGAASLGTDSSDLGDAEDADESSADETAPTFTIASSSNSLTTGQTATITVTLSEAASNFALSDISVSGGSFSNFTAVSGTVYTVVFTPATNSTANGVITIAAGAFSDSSGNANASAVTKTITVNTVPADVTAPTVSLSSSDNNLTTGETASITITLSEASTDFTSGDVTATGGTLSSFTAVSATVYTVQFTPATNSTTNGVVSVAAGVFTDAAGNANTGSGSVTMTVNTVAASVTTYTVTVANTGSYGTVANRYFINGSQQATLSLASGQTYKFDQSNSSNSTHPLRFSTTANGTHSGGSEYTTGVTTSGTAGQAGAYTQIVVGATTPTLHYYCVNHSLMGGTANTP